MGKRREREGDGAGGSHHGTRTIGLSCRQRLLQMQAHIDVQDITVLVPQDRSRLCAMSMYGAVFQRRAPDPTGQEADYGGSNHRGDGDGEA